MSAPQLSADRILQAIEQKVQDHEERFHGGQRCPIYRQQWASWIMYKLNLRLDEASEVIDYLVLFVEHLDASEPNDAHVPPLK